MSCGVVCRCGSDPALLWLWCRPVATAPVQSLARELPYATDAVLKSKKQKANKWKKQSKVDNIQLREKKKNRTWLWVTDLFWLYAESQIPSYPSLPSLFWRLFACTLSLLPASGDCHCFAQPLAPDQSWVECILLRKALPWTEDEPLYRGWALLSHSTPAPPERKEPARLALAVCSIGQFFSLFLQTSSWDLFLNVTWFYQDLLPTDKRPE